MKAVDNPGALRLGFLGSGSLVVSLLLTLTRRGFQLFGGRIAQNQDQALAVGRPAEVFDVLDGLGELLGLAAQPIEEVDLRLALVTLGKKGEKLVVGRPAGVIRGDAFRGQRDGIATGGGHLVDTRL